MAHRRPCDPCLRPRRHQALMPAALAIAAPVQCVVSLGGSSMVSATTRSATEGSSLAMREGRVLSRESSSTPSAANRSCQRQMQVLDLPVSRMIAFGAEVLGAEQHDLRSPHVLLRRVAVFDQIAKPVHGGRGDREGDAGSHTADSHRASRRGILTRDWNVRRDPRSAPLKASNRTSAPPLFPLRGRISDRLYRDAARNDRV